MNGWSMSFKIVQVYASCSEEKEIGEIGLTRG